MKDLTKETRKRRQRAATLPFLMFSQVPVAMAASVTLQWDQVSDPAVDHYEVAWGSNSGSYTGSMDAAGTSATVSGLTGGQTH
jgi:hypothetical protein